MPKGANLCRVIGHEWKDTVPPFRNVYGIKCMICGFYYTYDSQYRMAYIGEPYLGSFAARIELEDIPKAVWDAWGIAPGAKNSVGFMPIFATREDAIIFDGSDANIARIEMAEGD